MRQRVNAHGANPATTPGAKNKNSPVAVAARYSFRMSQEYHIGGTSPSLPTSTNAASIEPSSCFGPRAMIAAPGLRSV